MRSALTWEYFSATAFRRLDRILSVVLTDLLATVAKEPLAPSGRVNCFLAGTMFRCIAGPRPRCFEVSASCYPENQKTPGAADSAGFFSH